MGFIYALSIYCHSSPNSGKYRINRTWINFLLDLFPNASLGFALFSAQDLYISSTRKIIIKKGIKNPRIILTKTTVSF